VTDARSAAPCSLRTTAAALARGWHEFFHAPVDPRPLAVVRIAFAALMLLNLAVLWPDRQRWFSDSGVLTAETSRLLVSPHAWSLLWWLPDTPATIDAVFAVAFTSAALLLLGVLPRVTAACLFVLLYSLQMRNTLIFDSQDILMRMIAFCLIWVPSGQAWSLQAPLVRWPAASVFSTPPIECQDGAGGCCRFKHRWCSSRRRW
jgi:hypothetical protein